MKKLFVISFLFSAINLQAMEKQPIEKYKKLKEEEIEPKIQASPSCVPTLKNISIQKFLEIAPGLENLAELLASIPEEVQEEIRTLAQKKFPFSLHNAQSTKEIENFFTLGIDQNIKDESGKIALNALIYNRKLEEAIYLVDLISKDPDKILIFDVSTPDKDTFTPLQRAIAGKNIDLANKIITVLQKQNKIDSINVYNKEGDSALTYAIRYTPTLVKKLVKLGKNLRHTWNKKGETPLMIAAQYNPNLIEVLIKKGASPLAYNNAGYSALTSAIEYSQNPADTVRELLKYNANPNDSVYRISTTISHRSSMRALEIAIEKDQLGTVKLLLNAGAQITERALELAKDKPDIDELLNEHLAKTYSQLFSE